MTTELAKLALAGLVGIIFKIVWDWLQNKRNDNIERHLVPCTKLEALIEHVNQIQIDYVAAIGKINGDLGIIKNDIKYIRKKLGNGIEVAE